MLDDVGPDLDEARAKIEATRDELQAVLDSQEVPDARLAALVARLDRMAAEVGRVEDAVAEAVGEAMIPTR
jgi:predicted  nucleic acid-binding Zn-ribbon protein